MVFAVDGGSSDKFLSKAKEISNLFMVRSEGGLVSQVKRSLNEALKTNADYILYTESDKQLFFQDKIDAFSSLSSEILPTNPGMILASRTQESFSTFPPFQRRAEHFLNDMLANITGNVCDYSYGPRILSRDLLPHIDDLGESMGWGWMTYLVLAAHRLNKEVKNIELSLPCPPDQQGETENDKKYRLQQLQQHLYVISGSFT